MIEFMFYVAGVLQLVSGSLFVGARVEWVDICKGLCISYATHYMCGMGR